MRTNTLAKTTTMAAIAITAVLPAAASSASAPTAASPHATLPAHFPLPAGTTIIKSKSTDNGGRDFKFRVQNATKAAKFWHSHLPQHGWKLGRTEAVPSLTDQHALSGHGYGHGLHASYYTRDGHMHVAVVVFQKVDTKK